MPDLLGIQTGAIALVLVEKLRRDPHRWQMALESLDIVRRIARGRAVRIRDPADWAAQVGLEHLLLGQIGWHFAEGIEIIPAIDEAHFFPEPAERAGDEVDGD